MDVRSNYWVDHFRRPVSRRRLIRGAGVATAGLAGAALIGCGSDEPDDAMGTATPTAGTGGAGTATATPTQAAGAGGPKTGGTYRTHTTGDPPTIDPYGNLSFQTKGFAAYVYSRLYRIDAQENTNPAEVLPTEDLAVGTETDDGQTWVVTLKEGVKFHNKPPVDGRVLTSEDVQFSWERLTAPESPGANLVSGVTNFEAIDDHTIRFTLDAPSPTFVEMLADANILWVMPTESDGGFNPTQDAIGTGPWMLDEYQVSQRFRFSKNPDWFEDGHPLMDGVDLSIIPEYANSLAQFQAGNLEVLQLTSDDVLPMRRDRPEIQFTGDLPISLSHVYFSPADMSPDAPWRDERFRRAVSMSINRDEMSELLFNVTSLSDAGLEVTRGWNNVIPIGFGEAWWLDPQSEAHGDSRQYFEHNPDEARALLDAMGASGAAFKYIWTNNRYGARFALGAEAIGNWLEEIGLQPETETQDYSSVYITQTFRGNFDGVAMGPETPFPEVGGWVERLFGRDPANHGRIDDPTMNDLNARQKVEMDRDARRELIHEVQRHNAENMFYVPTQLGAGENWIVYQPDVRGFRRTRGYGGPTEQLAFYWFDR